MCAHIKYYKIHAQATTRIALSCAVFNVMIQLGHFLKKREYVHMPRFSEYFKLSEKWRCWFPFLTSAIIAWENIFAFLCPLGAFFPLVPIVLLSSRGKCNYSIKKHSDALQCVSTCCIALNYCYIANRILRAQKCSVLK